MCSLTYIFLAASATEVRSASRSTATICPRIDSFAWAALREKSHLSRKDRFQNLGRSEAYDWIKELDVMSALQPQTVMPGHSLSGAKQDASQFAYRQAYLGRYEAELQKAAKSPALIAAMKSASPTPVFPSRSTSE